MADTTNKPVIFLAFANDLDDTVGYLRDLPNEMRRLREVLESAEQAGLCEVVVRSNCTAGDLFKVFQSQKYRNRIAILHYGGHANGYQLLMESTRGESKAADADGLASFLAQQQGLQLVVLNGCSTQQQARGLLNANISAVIATSRSIDDQVATDFAHRFYLGLAGGASIRTAYYEAEAAVLTTNTSSMRALYYGESDDLQRRVEADHLPWALYVSEGSEKADQWNLPEAVNNPLFGLPPLPEQDLPESPYRHLNRFTRMEAEVFFGRGHQIRELHERLTATGTAPILLFYGQSGVGKSSMLDAGLIPRLEQSYEVSYERRNAGGLLETLRQAVVPELPNESIDAAWIKKEEQLGKPLIVLLDQVEEYFTRPTTSLPDELDQLLSALKATFGDRNHRPEGKLLLGFRKEWLAELKARMDEYEIPCTKMFLEPLNRKGIIEVVQGPDRTVRLREHYGLTVDDGLSALIADNMLEDHQSAIAPTLQILLTKMWAKATAENYEHPNFSQTLYQDLKRDGVLLRDFLDQQIAVLRKSYPEAVDSGLVLDILTSHTTMLGTAGQSNLEELQQQYAHQGNTLPDLLQQCQDLHLLTVASGTQKESAVTTRLAHDTLAPLIREAFDLSDLPGQRARRILDSRAIDWTSEKDGAPLDKIDLELVEEGLNGTRSLTVLESRLLDVSNDVRNRQRNTRRIMAAFVIFAGILTLLAGSYGLFQSSRANDQRNVALTQLGNSWWQRAAIARDSEEDEIHASHLFAKAASVFLQTEKQSSALSSLLAMPDRVIMSFPQHDFVRGASLDDNEAKILSWSYDGMLRIWNIAKQSHILTIEHSNRVLGGIFNNDGSQVLSWSDDSTARVTDIATNKIVGNFQHDHSVYGALYNRDETQILSWSSKKVYLWDIRRNELVQNFVHESSVSGAVFLKNDSQVLSWDNNGKMFLWNISEDEPLRIFESSSWILGALLNDDQSQVLSREFDGTITLWDIQSEIPLLIFEHPGMVHGALFDSEQTKILSWGFYSIVLWDIARKSYVRTFEHDDNINGAIFSGNGSQVLSWSNDSTVRLWNINQEEPERIFKHSSSVEGAMFSEDESKVLSWSGDGSVQLRDIASGKLIAKSKHLGYAKGATLTSDNSQVLSWSGDGIVRLWDATEDMDVQTYQHDVWIRGALFSGDETQVLSWGDDSKVRLWNTVQEEQPRIFEHKSKVGGAWFNSTETQVLSWSDKELVLWLTDRDEKFRTFEHDDTVFGALFISSDSHIVSWGGDGDVYLWDVTKDEPVWKYQHFSVVRGVSISRDEAYVLSWDDNGKMFLWDVAENEVVQKYQHDSHVIGAEFNNAGTRILSWSDDATAQLWSIETNIPIRTLEHGREVMGAMFNKDESKILSWSYDGTAKLWNVSQEKPIRIFEHGAWVNGARFNGDETRVMSWGDNGAVRLWSVDRDEELQVFRHNDGVLGAIFSSDDTRILSWSADTTARLWDTEQPTPIVTFRHDGRVWGAEFNDDESKVLSWSDGGDMRLWDIDQIDDASIESINDIRRELEVRTAVRINELGAFELLTFREWLDAQKQVSAKNPND